jgi:hypothetical protein
VGTTEVEARLADSCLFESNNGTDARTGLLYPQSTTIVTGKANMSYDIAPCNPVINRAAGEGIYRFSATGVTNAPTTAAPTANSRIDIIWVKQNDPAKADANNLAVAGVTQGVVAASPVAPAIPAGAIELARATVGPNITATTSASITQTFRYTALKDTPIKVRNVAERAEITAPRQGQRVARLDLDATGRTLESWNGTAWDSGFRHVEFVRANQADAPANTIWGPGYLDTAIDASQSRNYADWLSFPLNDQVRIGQEGLYTVQWKITPAASTTLWMGIGKTQAEAYQGEFGRTQEASVFGGDAYWTPPVTFYVPAAGQTLTFAFRTVQAFASVTHRIKLTKVA